MGTAALGKCGGIAGLGMEGWTVWGRYPTLLGLPFLNTQWAFCWRPSAPHPAPAKTRHFSLREAGLCARAHMSFTVSVIHRVLQICLKGNICGDFAPGLRNPRGPLDVEG